MNLGKIHGEDAKTYHATDAVSSHRLNDLNPYPLLYWKRWVAKQIPPEAQSPAMAFGQYFHTLALEGEDAARAGYIVAPVCDRRTTLGKIAHASFLEAAGGKQVITAEDEALAWRMVKAIREKPAAVEMLSRGKPEVTFRHKLAAFTIQSRADWFDDATPDAPLIIDVKTVESLAAFDQHFFKFNYYRQAAFYRLVVAQVLGLETFQPQFQYIVVEKNEPYQCAIRTPDAESLAIGTKEVMADLHKLKICYETNVWPGEPNEARPVSLPEHIVRKHAA